MKLLLKIFGCSKGKVKRLTINSNITKAEEKNNNAAIDSNTPNKFSISPNEIITENDNNNEISDKKEKEEYAEMVNILPDEEKLEQKKEIHFSEHGCNLGTDIPDDELLISQDSTLINPYEKDIVRFTKKDLVEFFLKMENHEDFREYYNKKNLRLFITQKGSPFSPDLFMIKTIYIQKKSELSPNDNPDNIIRLMYDVKERLKWEKAFKNLEIFEGGKECFVVRSWAHSQMIVISEREGIEKRMKFKFKGNWFCMSMSVPENVFLFLFI